jgi:hypothetical protein
MILSHWTCVHSAAGIEADGMIKPHVQPFLGRAVFLSWFTDAASLTAHQLGLHSVLLGCDRMEFRFDVDTDIAVPWKQWADTSRVERTLRSELELGRKHGNWWVAFRPIEIDRTETMED